jgi:hypothetical protein
VRLALAIATVFALGAPAAAPAAVLTLDKGCYTNGATISVSGSGFTRNGKVKLGGAANAIATADAGGDFAGVRVRAPHVSTAAPRRFTITATDRTAPSVRARVRVRVSRGPFWSNAPVAGVTTQRVTWRFAGFEPGLTIFGHLRFRGRVVATHRFGIAHGTCGVLSIRARRVPGTSRVRRGRWQIKLDQRRRYSPTAPGRIVSFSVAPR